MYRRGLAAVVLVFAGAVVASLPSASAHDDKGPIVIGHRGASAYRPEHTLAAYELAARMDRRVTLDGLRMSKKHMYFSSRKAQRELNYRWRDPRLAVAAAVDWFKMNGYF